MPKPAQATSESINLQALFREALRNIESRKALSAAPPVEVQPSFGPFIPTCLAHGIGRSTAFKLASAGIIETVLIGRRRFVIHESLRTLPERLAKAKAA